MLLEDVGEELDSLLDPILARNVFKQAGVPSIKMGDTILEYSYHFKLYITTRLRNPHFLPDVHSKVRHSLAQVVHPARWCGVGSGCSPVNACHPAVVCAQLQHHNGRPGGPASVSRCGA